MMRMQTGRSVCGVVTAATVGLTAAVILAGAGVPRIDHVEIVNAGSSKILTFHFNTEANRSYTLQRCTSFIHTNNGNTAVWSNIDFAPAQPFNDHWVGVDLLPVSPGTNLPVRFYRLMVTP